MWGGGAYENARRYVQLLLASLSPDHGIALGVKWLEYGFYVYGNYFGQYRTFQAQSARVLFPAVALNDRMVLVSQQLIPRLTAAEGLSLFRPLEAGGVLEVDFDQPELVDKAVQKVGDMLRAEAVQAVRRYTTYHPADHLDTNDLAEKLGLDAAFLEDALQKLAANHTFYEALSCQFSRNSFPMKRWTRVKVKIANASDVGLRNLSLNIRGPVRILPDRAETDVPANGAAELDISIQPDEEGEFPIEVVFTLPEDGALRPWLPTKSVWLTTAEDPN